ncbi:MAG: hypothetical protein IH886_14085 [Nitrospinae bacterium]|nr:hypothetical protein [Nitrospinota bacterium]
MTDHKTCLYNGKEYSHGSEVCQDGEVKICNNGAWDFTGTVCELHEEANRDDDKEGGLFSIDDSGMISLTMPTQTSKVSTCFRYSLCNNGNKLLIRNNCAECKIVVYNWHGHGVHKYKIDGYSHKCVKILGNGQPIGEEPCKD